MDDKIKKDFMLLKKIVNPNDSFTGKVDLAPIERLIFRELPDALEDNAPVNFPQLYFDFTHEYERFKDFILYDKLIGKNVVALGGGFSTGKSSFLNSLLDKKILPSNIDPSTSVPAYLVHDDEVSVYGVNTFGSRVELELDDVRAISHGFGKLDEDDSETTLGHILESVFISSPFQTFENIALLDTPGYSKAESAEYSAKTDEKIARAQLNSANYILWFVQADAGTITEEDIAFLKTLNEGIPKLVVVNRADKVLPEDLAVIVRKIKEVLTMKAIPFVDVLTYSRKKGFDDDREKILAQLNEWNSEVYENLFAYNFKILFTQCKDFYDEKIDLESKRLTRLNKATTLTDDNEVCDCLTSLIGEIKNSVSDLKEHKDKLKSLQADFFSEIKRIGDLVNIEMPEPSEIDLIRDKAVNPKAVLDEYCRRQNIRHNKELEILLADVFAGIKPVRGAVGSGAPSSEFGRAILENLNIGRDKIKFGNYLADSGEYVKAITDKMSGIAVAEGGVQL